MKVIPHSKAPRAGRRPGFLFVVAMLATGALPAQQPPTAQAPPAPGAPPAAEAPAAPLTESQREAAELLKSMAEYMADLESFRCTMSSGHETVQANGQKLEFRETRRITVVRPNRLRIEEVASDGIKDLVLFDGKQITMVSAGFNAYAQAPSPPNLEDALVYFVRDLRMRAPLALLLSTHVRTELPALAKNPDYVERTTINDFLAHHIAVQAESVDFELWIAEGSKPLPLRVVITYKTAPGQPKFWADLTEWKTKGKISASTFALSLPAGATQIPFAVQLSSLGATAPDVAATGEVTP
jgi:hypothetical protein